MNTQTIFHDMKHVLTRRGKALVYHFANNTIRLLVELCRLIADDIPIGGFNDDANGWRIPYCPTAWIVIKGNSGDQAE